MSKITGSERPHWHDTQGRHRMTDPRTFNEGAYPERFWDADERAYVEHLRQHERDEEIPQPRETDTPAVRSLFASIAVAEKMIRATRELINTLREKPE